MGRALCQGRVDKGRDGIPEVVPEIVQGVRVGSELGDFFAVRFKRQELGDVVASRGRLLIDGL